MEDDIVRLLKNQPDKGLRLLMKQYMGLVYHIVKDKLCLVGTKEDIEELSADVFAEIFRAREKIDLSKGSLKAYLCVIARNMASERYQQLMAKSIQESPLEEHLFLFDQSDPYQQCEKKTLLQQGIDQLSETDRTILTQKYYLGKSTKEIAQSLNLKTNTVDKRLERSKQRLKEILKGAF